MDNSSMKLDFFIIALWVGEVVNKFLPTSFFLLYFTAKISKSLDKFV